jgi:hypothetical protein
MFLKVLDGGWWKIGLSGRRVSFAMVVLLSIILIFVGIGLVTSGHFVIGMIMFFIGIGGMGSGIFAISSIFKYSKAYSKS